MVYINLMQQPFLKKKPRLHFIYYERGIGFYTVDPKRKKSEYNYMGSYQIAKVLDKHAYVIHDTNGNRIKGNGTSWWFKILLLI